MDGIFILQFVRKTSVFSEMISRQDDETSSNRSGYGLMREMTTTKEWETAVRSSETPSTRKSYRPQGKSYEIEPPKSILKPPSHTSTIISRLLDYLFGW
jgi:hypothetical protein